MRVNFTVNGRPQEADDVWEGESLLYVLRERLGLPGSKNACEQGECGSCTVRLDGVPVCSCLVAAGQVEGREVVTVEGLADYAEQRSCGAGACGTSLDEAKRWRAEGTDSQTGEGTRLAPIQQAFIDAGAVQCGFCTPGLLVAADEMLERNPNPTDADIREALSGNLCRCTGYEKIMDAVRLAAPGSPGGLIMTSAELSTTFEQGGAPSGVPTTITQGSRTKGGIGESTLRPDGTLKVTGEFAYSSDMWHEDMLWGHILRSTVAHAEILSIDTSQALATPGVHAVMTYDDLPTDVKNYGLEIQDTPVLAHGKVRHHGEPVAIVAADHPETARRAAAKIKVDYRELPVVTDEASALAPDAILVHEDRTDHHAAHVPHPNIVHRQPIVRGDVTSARERADVIVEGEYHFGMQDQAFLGPESGLAVPAEDGGVDLYIATQWLHADLRQIAPVLGLPEDKVRMTLAGVGGAFGGREDLSMQIHACLLALRTGKPVKIVYNRFESFFGHVHRHPAKLYYEHGATKDGRLTHVKCRIVLDGGAYASSSPAVVGNASSLGVGPYVVDDVDIEAIALYTNNPPCGAMRGFGAVQACFAYEAQMDKLAKRLGMDPVEFRQRNAMSQGAVMPTGQVVDSPAPVAELLRRVKAMPLPPERQWESSEGADVRQLPGGLSNTTHGEGVVRGVGYAVGIKNVGFSEGFDDYSTAKVRMEVVAGEPVATVHTAMAEVGQGGVTVHAQIARTELGVAQVTIHPADTQVGSAGSTSASRQTYVTGGAVKHACELVREKVLELGRRRFGSYHPAWATAELLLEGGKVVTDGGEVLADLVDVLGDEVVEIEREWRHRPTEPFDLRTGQGNGHVQYSFAAHRAVVEIDTELGLVKVIELACAQDVGKALNPLSVTGQIQGGTTQGLGIAVMEEIVVDPKTAKVKNPSFTDYLIPTILDTPTIPVDVLELADDHAPYGLRGVGEAPTLSSTPAVLAAVRNATGLELNRTPVRPEHLTGTA